MTTYWDEWGAVHQELEKAIKEKNETKISFCLDAFYYLIQELHDFDHQSDKILRKLWDKRPNKTLVRYHFLDNYFENCVNLELKRKVILCKKHDFFPVENQKDILECFFCKFQAHKNYLKDMGLLKDV